MHQHSKRDAFILVTDHSMEKFRKNIPSSMCLEEKKLKGIILAMYYNGVEFGAQFGNAFLIRSTHTFSKKEGSELSK